MPKAHTFPTLYDEVLKVRLSKLKEWGYLRPNQYTRGTITWSRRGEQTGQISLAVNTRSKTPYIELDYCYGKEHRNYKASLVSVPSNLGKGNVWYFLCPNTGKRCRILYSVGGYFLHREAFKGCMYETQTYSARDRALCRIAEITIGNAVYDELHSKYFRTHYAGKLTKRYLRLEKKIQQAKRFSHNDIEGLYLGILPDGF